MVDFRGLPNNIGEKSVQTEPLQQKRLAETPKTTLSSKIQNIFKQNVDNLRTFFQKVADNKNCVSHYISLRNEVFRIKKLAVPLFKKIAENLKQKAGKLMENRVIRKFKDSLEYLQGCDFKFVRQSEDPLRKDKLDQLEEELLEKYRDYEENTSVLPPGDLIAMAIDMLKGIAKIKFKPEQFQIRNAMVAEVLTKYIVSQPIPLNLEMPIPCFDAKGYPIVVDYINFKRLSLGESGLPVYIFIPKIETDRAIYAPFLIFRGTRLNLSDETDIRSIIENLNRIGPARGVYDDFKSDLITFFQLWFTGNKTLPLFRIMGFSQGAVLGQRAIVDFHKYLLKDSLNSSILFNSPGVEADYAVAWEKIIPEEKPSVINYLVTHDIVSKRGVKFIGEVLELQPLEHSIFNAHLGAKFLAQSWVIFEVDNDKEAESYSRKLVNQVMSSGLVEGLYKLAAFGLGKLQSRGKKQKSLKNIKPI